MSSGEQTPEQAILTDLARPLGRFVPLGPPGEGGVQAGTVRDGRADVVDLDSVRFGKQRRSPTRQVQWVTWRGVDPRFGSEPQEHRGLYEVVPDVGGGWKTRNVSGGSGSEPAWERPTVNLGGGGWPDHFSAGGTVVGAGHEIARVELRFANGAVLADDVQDRVVVFVTDEHVETPTTAVLFSPGGAEIRAHEVIPGF